MFTIPEAEGPNPPAWALDHVGLTRNKIATWQEQHARCCYCYKETWLLPFTKKGKREDEATAEHVVPKSQGGKNNYQNIVMACSKCNSERSSMDAMEYWELKQCPQKYAAWRAEVKAIQRANARASEKRREKRLMADARENRLTLRAYKQAMSELDLVIFEAHILVQSTPWTIPLCSPPKSCQPSLGETASIAPLSKSLLSRIASWLSTSRMFRFRSVTMSRSISGETVSTF